MRETGGKPNLFRGPTYRDFSGGKRLYPEAVKYDPQGQDAPERPPNLPFPKGGAGLIPREIPSALTSSPLETPTRMTLLILKHPNILLHLTRSTLHRLTLGRDRSA